jgi:hypothetical protein
MGATGPLKGRIFPITTSAARTGVKAPDENTRAIINMKDIVVLFISHLLF